MLSCELSFWALEEQVWLLGVQASGFLVQELVWRRGPLPEAESWEALLLVELVLVLDKGIKNIL